MATTKRAAVKANGARLTAAKVEDGLARRPGPIRSVEAVRAAFVRPWDVLDDKCPPCRQLTRLLLETDSLVRGLRAWTHCEWHAKCQCGCDPDKFFDGVPGDLLRSVILDLEDLHRQIVERIGLDSQSK